MLLLCGSIDGHSTHSNLCGDRTHGSSSAARLVQCLNLDLSAGAGHSDMHLEITNERVEMLLQDLWILASSQLLLLHCDDCFGIGQGSDGQSHMLGH